MKLSKAQQDVVDKMRGGANLTYVYGLFPRVLISNGKKLNIRTFYHLKKMEVIESVKTVGICIDFQLTEKYRTNEH